MDRIDQQPQQPTPSPGDILMAARVADHLTHCPPCRDRRDASDAATAANGASMARRDRIQLGLRIKPRTAVTA